jgi:spore coat polysaccharide biosynthesis protein SpsF
MRGRVEIFEGQEHDVLSRYYQALRSYRSDYIVRVTGDCYYLPSHTIARHIKRVLKHPADYVNNVLERCIPEGFDCELISQQLLVWLHENAKTASEREHVTSLIPKKIEEGVFPQKFKICTATDQLDFSHLKTSIDTAEDYERACQEFETRKKKYENSIRIGSVF